MHVNICIYLNIESQEDIGLYTRDLTIEIYIYIYKKPSPNSWNIATRILFSFSWYPLAYSMDLGMVKTNI